MILETLIHYAPLPKKFKHLLLQHIEKLYFLAVGATAAGVHWIVATSIFLLHYHSVDTDLNLFICNLWGFVLALSVSVFGHSMLTFASRFEAKLAQQASQDNHSRMWLILKTMGGQALVGIGSFLLNNILLYLGNMLNIYFPVLLFGVLLIVAVITFLVSKYLVYKVH